jgi:Putative Ig domain/CARDB
MKRAVLIIAAIAVTAIIILSVLPVMARNTTDKTGNTDTNEPSYSSAAVNNDDPFSIITGKNLSFSLSATDPDNDYLVYSVTNLPPGATFDSRTGEFSWTPGYDQAGVYDVHFEVSDGSLTDSEDITITVYDADVIGETGQSLISVSSLRITPSKASTGKNINITVTVTNNGNSSGVYEVILMINGVAEGSKTVTLGAGAAQNVKFSTSQNVPGTYQVDVNGLTGSFIIEASSNGGDTQSNGSSPPSKGGKNR